MKKKIASILSWLGILMVGFVCVWVIIWMSQGLIDFERFLAIEIFVFGLILILAGGFLSGQIKFKTKEEKVVEQSKSFEEKKHDEDVKQLIDDLNDGVSFVRQEMLNIIGEWTDENEGNNIDKAKLACNELRMYLDNKLFSYKERVGEEENSSITGYKDALLCVENLYQKDLDFNHKINEAMYRLERTIFADYKRSEEPSESELQLILVLCISISKYISEHYTGEVNG